MSLRNRKIAVVPKEKTNEFFFLESDSINEEPCGDNLCGECGLPNPMNTDTKEEALFGLAVLLSPKYQNAITKRLGLEQSMKSLSCEFNRVKKILEEKYGVKVSVNFRFKS